MSVQCGGLGMRSATTIAPLAFLSSRESARPMVQDLFMTMESKGLGKARDTMEQYDARTSACLEASAAG